MTRKTFASHAVAAALAIALPLQALAAVDAFLKLDGIEGEATDDRHKGEIVVESFSFGVSRGGTASATGGAGAGKVCTSDISVMKVVDKASPLLLAAAVSGAHIKEGVITMRKAGGTQQDFLVIRLQDILVSSVSHSAGGDLPAEALSLNFASITFSYRPQGTDGQLLPAVQTSFSVSKC